ncbi:MAG: hypothetical protein ACR2PZ_09585 [Pseudomonadales bacterium]
MHDSMLMPALFQRLDPDSRLTVLDLGAASGETVAAFSEFKCRLNFVDLLGELSCEDLAEDADPIALKEKFRGLVGEAEVDVLLLWDVLNYLPVPALEAFDACLQPLLGAQTQVHGISVRSPNTSLDWVHYGLHGESKIGVQARSGEALPSTPNPPSVLNSTLTVLRVQRGILLRDGRLEVSLGLVPTEAEAA